VAIPTLCAAKRHRHPDCRESARIRQTLSGFKRRYRNATGVGRLKRGADVPIAVLVSKVRMKKRLDVRGVVQAQVQLVKLD
jgi:hypothetical protein